MQLLLGEIVWKYGRFKVGIFVTVLVTEGNEILATICDMPDSINFVTNKF